MIMKYPQGLNSKNLVMIFKKHTTLLKLLVAYMFRQTFAFLSVKMEWTKSTNFDNYVYKNELWIIGTILFSFMVNVNLDVKQQH
mgnify:CR=1 FL=1